MFRFTFHFTNYTQGWSETLFRNENFSNLLDPSFQNYISRRLELLATSCALVGVRASNTNTKRDISILELPLEGRGGAFSSSAGPGDPPPGLPSETEDSFTALLLRLTDGNQNYRNFPLLGLPDHILQASIISPPYLAQVKGRLNNWIGAMTAASLGGKFAQADPAGGRIVEFPAKTPENQLVCLGITGAVPAVGSLITLGSVKPWSQLNRTWRVSSVIPAAGGDPAYIYLARSSGINTFGPVEGGIWKQPTFGVNTLNAYTISRITSRKTGVPFTTVRGRR
jgi:hypothetical protein